MPSSSHALPRERETSKVAPARSPKRDLNGDAPRWPEARTSTERDAPAHSDDAEQVVLGAMMMSPTVIDQVRPILSTADFYRPQHSLIYKAILGNADATAPTDARAIGIRLSKTGELAAIGGAPYLHTLVASVPSAGSAGWYAREVQNQAYARCALESAMRLQQATRTGDRQAIDRTLRQIQDDLAQVGGGDDSSVIPAPVFLEDLFAEEDEETSWRIQGLWPRGGQILLAAAAKSGKTTTTGNVLRALVDGDRLFRVFPVEAVADGRVAVLDFEMPRRSLKRWLRDQGIQNTQSVMVWAMRGQARNFDVRDATLRKAWIDRLRAASVKVWIIDCLGPVLSALGIEENNNTEVGGVLDGITSAAAEAGVDEVLLVHHMGHGPERSRGASRLIDWPDVNWKIVRRKDDGQPGAETDDNAARYFKAFGRDVDVSEGRLIFDDTTRHLTFAEGGRKSDQASMALGRLLAYVADRPGSTAEDLEKATGSIGLGRNEIRKALKDAKDRGYLSAGAGKGRALPLTITGAGRTQVRLLSDNPPSDEEAVLGMSGPEVICECGAYIVPQDITDGHERCKWCRMEAEAA